MYHKIITEKKNRLNNSSNKEKVLEIKQNLFQELTTQSSQKNKYKDNDDFNNKYINFLKSRTNEENTFPDSDIIYGNTVSKKNNNNYINKHRNQNIYKPQSQNKRNKTLTVIKSINNFKNEEDDLMYIIAKNPNKINNVNPRNKNKNQNENIISRLALPFCHYHKFNLKLPKKYTCNFKNCSCCQFKDPQNFLYYENTKETSRDYIYPSIEKTQRSNKRYNNVLEKYISKNKNKNKNKKNSEDKSNKKKKNIKGKKYIKKKVEENSNIRNNENINNKKINNINLKKANYFKEENNNSNNISDKNNGYNSRNNSNSKDSINSDKMSNISFEFRKPDETNLKIPKKVYLEKENSLSDSFSLEVPEEINIKDENYLKQFKDLVSQKNRKSKIHFSVTYYQKLNKSYKVYRNKEKKNSPFKAKSKEKKFEFLRYE